ncbi:MAG: peptidoglycan O-acetyltransferase [Bacteroidota bacterium]|jgi:D-alanyl-lipoteichoic acid acyltransferase DltB (MBOAT superfamily)
MLFNSLAFAIFLPLVFGIYWWIGRFKHGLRLQNGWIILSGYFFYGWWDWRFLALLFTATAVDFWVGVRLGRIENKRTRSGVLMVSLVMNLGMLGTFKYFDFFSEGFQNLLATIGLHADVPILNILLPVGISFYTFQTLSYTIDVYRLKMEPTRDPLAFFAFVSFFPPLVAGPIERASHLLPQMLAPRKFSYPLAVVGLRLLLWGLFKKVVIADALAPYVEYVFGSKVPCAAVDVALAVLFFGIQLYCDFSGYSDIAMGCARLLGFELNYNFKRPYFARSLQDFWQRWHISLTSWFRDYVYVTLGGNRQGPKRQAANILIVFLLSGLWHGASVTFVLWGAVHGLWFVIERTLKLPERLPRWIVQPVALTVAFGSYVFFRSVRLDVLGNMLTGIGNFTGKPLLFHGMEADYSMVWPTGMVLLYFSGLIGFLFLNDALFDFSKVDDRFQRLPRWSRWGYYYLLAGWLLVLGAYGTPQQFIYFQF